MSTVDEACTALDASNIVDTGFHSKLHYMYFDLLYKLLCDLLYNLSRPMYLTDFYKMANVTQDA